MLRRNIAYNYLGSAVSAVVPIAAIGIYVRALGIGSYGLISFVMVLQAIIGVAEGGISQLLVREFTACRIDGNWQELKRILSRFEMVYVSAGVLILVLVPLLTDSIVLFWLKVPIGERETAEGVVKIASVLLACFLPGSLYKSVLLGMESHKDANMVNSFSIVIKHVVGVLVCTVAGSAVWLMYWFAISGLMETGVKRLLAFKHIQRYSGKGNSDSARRRVMLKGGIRMSVATVIGAATLQADKIVASHLLSVSDFAVYSLAYTLAAGFLQVVYPVHTSFLPVFIERWGSPERLMIAVRNCTAILTAVILAGWVVIIVCGRWLLDAWLNDDVIARSIYAILIQLYVGTTLNAAYGIVLNILIATKKYAEIQNMNLAAGLSSTVVLLLAVKRLGLQGVAAGWIMFNGMALAMAIYYFSRKKPIYAQIEQGSL